MWSQCKCERSTRRSVDRPAAAAAQQLVAEARAARARVEHDARRAARRPRRRSCCRRPPPSPAPARRCFRELPRTRSSWSSKRPFRWSEGPSASAVPAVERFKSPLISRPESIPHAPRWSAVSERRSNPEQGESPVQLACPRVKSKARCQKPEWSRWGVRSLTEVLTAA